MREIPNHGLAEQKRLLCSNSDPVVSIYLPSRRDAPNEPPVSLRLKNITRDASGALQAWGLSDDETARCLRPVTELKDDLLFWRQPPAGLALFLSPDQAYVCRCPLSFTPQVFVDRRFNVLPLLPLLQHREEYFVLALSLNHIRLIQASPFDAKDVTPRDVPRSLESFLGPKSREKQLQFHTGVAGSSPIRPAVHHGHGGCREGAVRKRDILRLFQQVDSRLHGYLHKSSQPLILAGVDYLHGLYREANRYPRLIPQGLRANSALYTPTQLRALTWPLVAEHFRARRREILHHCRSLMANGHASVSLSENLVAAHHARVATLLVNARDHHRWGSFDEQAQEVEILNTYRPGAEDLVNRTVAESLLSNAEVHTLDPERFSIRAATAAIFRYAA